MFLNPVMLAGVGGAVVPLVLHFLSRSRFRTVDWGGMMFLGERERRVLSGAAARQWTLLALRMAIVGLLAMALARPVVAGWWGDAGGRRLVVLVMDCSASMGVEEAAGRTRMELAREAALRVLSRAEGADAAGLVVVGDGPVSATLSDVRSVAGRVAGVAAGAGAADVSAGLTAALDLCERADAAGRQELAKEVFLITDRQARSWDGVGDAFASAWQARWASARRATRLYAVPVGGDRAENVTVEALELVDAPVVRGQPVGIEVRVRNHGRQARAGVPVTVSVGEQVLHSATVSIEPGAAEVVRATVNFPEEAGPRVVSAAVTAGDLAADNRLSAAVDVQESLKVLVVGEKPKYVPLALAPFVGDAAKGGANLATVTSASATDANLAFAGMDVVVLANVPTLPEAVVGRLEQFVYGGGGLVIAPGPATQIEPYRRLLYRNGAGVMPAALRAGGAQVVGVTSLLGMTLEHPVFRFLRGAASPVPAVSVERYFRADVREGDARVLATYATGEPFLVEGAFGRGRVLLVTTPLEGEWSDLPLTGFYLPLVQSCVRYVAGQGAGPRVVDAGETLVVAVEGDVVAARVTGPDGRVEDADVVRAAGRSEVRYEGARLPGVYVAAYESAGAKREARVAVRVPAGESDLTPMGDEAWERVRRMVGFEEWPDEAAPRVGAAVSTTALLASLGNFGRELWLPLLAGVVALMLAETALARAWSQGGHR